MKLEDESQEKRVRMDIMFHIYHEYLRGNKTFVMRDIVEMMMARHGVKEGTLRKILNRLKQRHYIRKVEDRPIRTARGRAARVAIYELTKTGIQNAEYWLMKYKTELEKRGVKID